MMQKIVVAIGPRGGGRTEHLIDIELSSEYEFTGEFRKPKVGDYVFWRGEVVCCWTDKQDWCDTLILRKRKPIAPPFSLTVADVYGTDNPIPSNGWEFTGEFRFPAKKDHWLSLTGLLCSDEQLTNYTKGPRLILRRKA